MGSKIPSDNVKDIKTKFDISLIFSLVGSITQTFLILRHPNVHRSDNIKSDGIQEPVSSFQR